MNSKKLILACAVISAILVPLAVLGHGWIGEGEKDMGRRARLALGNSAGAKCAGGMFPKGDPGDWDVEDLKEKLDLTEEEVAELEVLIEEARGLRDQLKEKLEKIKDIIGPKMKERAEEIREECTEIAEDVKPLLEELRELHGQLCEAVEAGDDESVAGIKSEIEATTDELKEIKEELTESGCPVIGPEVRKRMEVARKNCRNILEKVRNRIKANVEKRECVKEVCEDLSEEDREALESIKEEIIELKDDFREAITQQDRESIEEIRNKISELMEEIRNIYVGNGLCSCFSG